MQEQVDFAQLGIAPELVELLHRNNLGAPTEVQVRIIPEALKGRDCLARVRSGSGKTNAYILPIVQRVDPEGGLQALVFLPTKALAAQLERNMRRYSGARDVRVALAESPGPRGFDDRRPRSRYDTAETAPVSDNRPPHVLVGTPRGIEERLNPRLNANDVRYVVLDEADVLLEQDGRRVEELLAGVRNDRQVFILSSTFDDRVRAFSTDFQQDPLVVEIEPAAAQSTRADQAYMRVAPGMQFDMLLSFAKQLRPRLALVYARDEETGRHIAERLARARVDARWIDDPPRGGRRGDRAAAVVVSDPPPPRVGTLPISHVVHYDPPADAETYRARLDSATRLNRTGYSLLLVEAEQSGLVDSLATALAQPLREMEPLQVPERARRDDRGGRGDRHGRGPREDFDRGGDEGQSASGHGEFEGAPASDDGTPREPMHREGGEGGDRGRRDDRRDGGRRGRDRREGGRGRHSDDGPRRERGGRDGGRGGDRRGSDGSGGSAPRAPGGLNSTLAAMYGPLHRDAELEARGLSPLPRTLGSRFPSQRRRSSPPRLRRLGQANK